ncbi:MAG: class I mannose-6-phosphate isomerase [Kiritimatiellae bacterium]|nr:class I mannose-6-phosphate isomerase [Kiritimatiellia bacterium]
MKSNYDKFPSIKVPCGGECRAFSGWDAIGGEISARVAALAKSKTVVCVDAYHGVWEDEVLAALEAVLKPDAVIETREANKTRDEVRAMLAADQGDDRVFAVMSHKKVEDWFDPAKVAAVKRKIEAARGTVLVFGVAAAVCCPESDIYIYADMARWEIQMRFRSGKLSNWLDDNAGEDALRLYKRGFFADWRALDRHKRARYGMMDYVLDTNDAAEPKMMTGAAFRRGLEIAASRPFRVKPYFDPGVWGGQWMKEKFDLDPSRKNYAWSFDCVPEENSLLMDVGGVTLETPSINLVFAKPVELLGDKVHARFGAEFPIRFDMLDTMRGGNLSLQCHPLTEYIQDAFGMHYTQDESYYLLDADASASPVVYLGKKTGVTREEFAAALRESEKTGTFDALRYVNAFPAKKHDHFLIPGGTLHCSGANCMVLEISATPYIFTFKMWDWGRLGLDGRPRPIHVEHALANIQFDRDTEWVRKNLVGRVETISERPGVKEERTGLHEREFIETRRHWFTEPVVHDTCGGVNVLNLVEGEEATVESPTCAFAPFTVHYAETFIVPAAVGKYVVRPSGPGAEKLHATIKAYVRT